MNALKTTLTKALIDGKGRFVSLATGAAVAATAKYFTSKNWDFNPEFENLVSISVAFATTWILDSIVLHLQTAGVKKIQDALPSNVTSDGVPGDITVAAVKRAVSDQQS